MHRCYDVSRKQNFVCNIQTHISNYAGKLMRRLVSLVDQDGAQCPSCFPLFSSSTFQDDSCNAAQYLTVHFHYRTSYCFFFFQNIKLNSTSTEGAHCSKDANGNRLLGENSAESYSWQICKNSFSHRNILSGHTSESRKETTSYSNHP
jgi:hypothetical protein